MKKYICFLLSILITVSSVTVAFARNDPKDKDKGKKITINVNDNVTGNSVNQFQYSGSWNYGKQGGAYQQDNHWSNSKDSFYTVTFYGEEIRLYAAKANIHGIAAISIDGGNEKLVDFYSIRRSDNTCVYSSNKLKEGNHTLKVRITGNKNNRSKDSTITADRVEIKTSYNSDKQAPSAPTGLTGTPASTSQINLNWNASSDNIRVQGYKVYRNGAQIGTVTKGTSYSDKRLHNGTTYSYAVTAYDESGNNSGYSNTINVSTLNQNPTNLALKKAASSDSLLPGYNASYGNDGSMSTMWCAADSNPNHWWQVDLGVGCSIIGTEVTWQFGNKLYKYTIQVSTDGTNWVNKVDKNNNTNTSITQKDSFNADNIRYVRINVTGVPDECWAAIYEFKVIGVTGVSGDTQAPSVPGSLSVSPESPTQVKLSWTASTDNVGVQGYKIYRDSRQIATVQSNTCTDAGLQPGKTYKYSVASFDAAGNNSAKTAAITITTPTPAITNLALNKNSYSDSEQKENPTQRGNDGSLSTRWAAADGNANHWWKVDLGALYNLTGTEITWELPDKAYNYKIEVSADNVNWTVKVDKKSNLKKQQIQKDVFTASSVRYVRITVTGLQRNSWVSFYELKVFGY